MKDLKNIMAAAVICRLALSKMAPCIEDALEEELCHVFCCCKDHPVISPKGRKLRQRCADLMMSHTRQPGCRYENAVPYRMDTLEPIPRDQKTMRRMYREIKNIRRDEQASAILKANEPKIRIPDISAYDEAGKLSKIYEFKFPGDHWRNGQKKAYEELVGRDDKKVIKLDETRCKCGQRKPDKSKVTDREIEAALEMFSKYFSADWEKNREIILEVMRRENSPELEALAPEMGAIARNALNLGKYLLPLCSFISGIPGIIGVIGRVGRVLLPLLRHI